MSIPYFRMRKQRSGKNYFYISIPGDASRQEVAAGCDQANALLQRSSILFKHFYYSIDKEISVQDIFHWYLLIVVPLLPSRVKAENTNSIQKLLKFVEELNLLTVDLQILKNKYQQWADPRLTLRTAREVALLSKILKWFETMKNKNIHSK